MRSHRDAFTLTEMLFIIMLMGVAALMSARLFTASLRVISSAPRSQDAHAAVDRMSFVLRNDVWSATSIDASDGRNVTLTQPGGVSIHLYLRGAELARSSSQAHQETRFSTGVPLSAYREGAWLVLRSDKPGVELRFASQILESAGER